jgi:signal peptidase II
MRRRTAGYVLAAIVLVADQVTKYFILHNQTLTGGNVINLLPILNLVLVWNHGITFGMFAGAGAKLLLATIASAVIIALMIWLWRVTLWSETLAIGAITGGAIGNVADRVDYGAVVDFLQAHAGGLYFPWVFNIGDSAITCGVGALIVLNILGTRNSVA